jgi:hypothetical protein
MEKLRAAFDVLNIGNPVVLPSREARLLPFIIKTCRRTTKERLIDSPDSADTEAEHEC